MSMTLIRGKYVICKIDGSDVVTVSDGAVVQQDGTIITVGSYEDLISRYRPDEVFGSQDHIVMPGFVNSHHHIGLTPFQLGSPDYPLELWAASRMAARDVDPYLDTLYSAIQMLESGITTVHHIQGILPAPWSRWPRVSGEVIRAYRDIGMRVNYTFGFRDQNHLVYADDDFARQLPDRLSAKVAAYFRGQVIPLDDYLSELFVGIWESHGRNKAERTRVALAPLNLHWCSDTALLALKDFATQYNVGMHVHLLETIYQKEYARRRTGSTAVRHLKSLGLLGPELTLGHSVWVTDEDVDLITDTRTMICHNASSNLRLRSGIAPLNRFLARGVRVAMGIDEAGINDDRDMLQEMRLVLKLHRVPGMDEQVPTAAQVFQMATENGALTTGYANEVGVLEPGKAADLVLINWKHIAHPYLESATPVIDAVVQRGRPSGIETVIVAGEAVLKDGHSTRLDKHEVLTELAESLQKPLRPDELDRRDLSAELFPYVAQFYADWQPQGPVEPFYRVNSRL